MSHRWDQPAATVACPDFIYRAVPSAVTGLQVEDLHSTHSLQVSWEEARGVADGYVLQLLDDRGSLVTNCSLASGETRYRVGGLTAGRKYRVQVQTTSGGVHSQRVTTEARTCKSSSYILIYIYI